MIELIKCFLTSVLTESSNKGRLRLLSPLKGAPLAICSYFTFFAESKFSRFILLPKSLLVNAAGPDRDNTAGPDRNKNKIPEEICKPVIKETVLSERCIPR